MLSVDIALVLDVYLQSVGLGLLLKIPGRSTNRCTRGLLLWDRSLQLVMWKNVLHRSQVDVLG